ncbi:hypothetical protein ZWY2020_026381 [Hordeum vulgare]|nr:hypothetical protein ZWY2020_026381 [Hordeum vulgare]
MVRVRRTSAPLLAAAVVAAVAVACSLGSGAYAAAEQEAVGAGAGAGVDDLWLRQPPITRGLSFDFYKRSCPRAESIVRHFVRDAVRKDVGLAAGLLRLHFHDCFVQGCDASVLLDGSAPPNLTLRPSAFKAINDIRDRLERECRGAVVSCSDILALAATPCWPPAVPSTACPSGAATARSSPRSRTCCPASRADVHRAVPPQRGPVHQRQHPAHRIVERFARSQRNFFNQFGVSMVKMGQIKVLTGGQGQVRRNCSARNPGTVDGNLGLGGVANAAAESLGF